MSGPVTAQSNVVERTQDVNTPGLFAPQGILGAGISIGIVSDSYDTRSGVPRASVGVSAGNLPGTTNPNGYTTPVVVLQDTGGSDEGRGMAEIVHDIAPAAKICFSGAGQFQSTMAQSIRNLRTSGLSQCDIIADDVYFVDELFFSDGPIAKAIDDVVTSNALAGKKVVYFSAAGNDSNSGYSSDVNRVTAAAGMAAVDNLNFSGVPANLYTGGFHNLNPGGATAIAMKATTSGSMTVSLQWDDPFQTVTTDYNLLVFSSSGSYLGSSSGTDNNFNTQMPIELASLGSGTYQLVIALASSAPPTATHLHLAGVSGDVLSGPYIVHDAIAIFGHPAAANANAVGAYAYSNTPNTTPSYNPGHVNPPPGPYRPILEGFSSTGGNMAFYFDANGNRLVTPNIRAKPEFSACDNVDTSFFPPSVSSDYDNDNFPNFAGTSAAAPTAAAIGALMLEAAGGPGSLTPAQVRSLMQQTTFPHDLNPDACNATATNGVATVQVNANGNASNDSASSPTFFTVNFNGNSGQRLNQLVIDFTNTALVFDESANGFAFTVGSNPSGVSVSRTLSPNKKILTLDFGNTFQPGQTLSFGIDRDLGAINAAGNSADLLGGAKIKATVDSNTILFGGFGNLLGAGFTFADGFGLVDARKAVATILGSPPASTSVAANISTRAVTATGDNVLIGGFIAQGSASKTVIVRALGPSLVGAGVSGALADPTLELHDGQGSIIAFDDNWEDDPDQAALIQGTGLAPNDPSESALVGTLTPGNYTAIVRGLGGSSGIALVEVYDLDGQPAPSQLANISTRAPVQTDDGVLIGGFIVKGNDSPKVIVRALGPSLVGTGLTGVLPDPTIELRDGQGALLASNDDWQQDSLLATQIQATGFAPGNPLESAILTSLSAGPYTAIVRGVNTTTGIGLVEVYNLK